MKQLVIGLFQDSTAAGEVISELKSKGYTKEISLVSRDEFTGKTTSHSVKQDPTPGIAAGAVTGAAMGVFAGVLAGLASVALPGVGTVVVAGPLFATWAAAGAATGAIAGGIVGGLVDIGIPEEKARLYEKQVRAGQVLVAVTTEDGTQDEVAALFQLYGVSEMTTLQLPHTAAV